MDLSTTAECTPIWYFHVYLPCKLSCFVQHNQYCWYSHGCIVATFSWPKSTSKFSLRGCSKVNLIKIILAMGVNTLNLGGRLIVSTVFVPVQDFCLAKVIC